MKTPTLRLSLPGLAALHLLASAPGSHAATTIAAAYSFAYGANLGWMNCRGDVTNGAVVGEFVCSGSIYSANCGWISLGSGTPANGFSYANNSATDFGVNVTNYSSDGTTAEAQLRGSAYGANIGWIKFDATGNPRVNLSTGQLSGFAYGANVGWIALSGTGITLTTSTLPAGTDTDTDNIPDAWERQQFSNLTTATATTDADGDGRSDAAEYLAGTDPRAAGSSLKIISHTYSGGFTLATIQFTSTASRLYRIEHDDDLLGVWTDSGFGTFVPAAGSSTTRAFSIPASPRRFFRAVAVRPLPY